MKSDMKRKKMFAIGLILSLIIFFTINAVSYWNTKRHIESRVNVEKTLTILYELENLISVIKDAENGQRGFIITGSWLSLEPYYDGITAVHKSMKAIKELTPIDDQAYQKLDIIQGLIEKRFGELHKTITLRKKRGIEAAIKSFMTSQDEKVMADIRNLVKELKHEKTNLLQGLNRISEVRSHRTLLTILTGNLVALLFVFFSLYQLSRDIAERKQAEDELRQYEHIVSSAKDMLALIDKNFVYLSANAAYIQAFAKTSDQIIGRTMTDVFGEEFFGTVIRPRAERCLAGESIRYQYWFDFPAAGRRYMDIAYSPYFGTDGEVGGFVITARDITEYDNLQSQLVQAQKMESVGRLAGGVAHDYNNMLSVILGYTELALDKVDPNDPLHADLQEILTAARRSTDITRQLLAFARKQTVAPKVLDLNKTLEAMLKMLRKLIGEDIDLAWHPRANLWPVKMDPSQVDQILANLCVNARDAIAGVGKVTIETDKTTFDAAYCSDHVGFIPGEFALLAVSDNGRGMDKETLNKLFEPFFTTKGVGRGTGLGLATVYGIVKQNDGFINVYSEPGKGTTFKIYLPRHAGEAEGISAEGAAEIPKGHGEIVLVVEDEASILKLANRILDGLGYKVLTAGTPGEAMVLAKEHADNIHLLITDVVMPEMNGRELADRLQALYPDLKTLFMSGYTANVIAHRGVLEAGVCFIPKPFSKKALAVKVREALDK
jgi:PAS domain S-box-containing protein